MAKSMERPLKKNLAANEVRQHEPSQGTSGFFFFFFWWWVSGALEFFVPNVFSLSSQSVPQHVPNSSSLTHMVFAHYLCTLLFAKSFVTLHEMELF
jgi:hypothetical protein